MRWSQPDDEEAVRVLMSIVVIPRNIACIQPVASGEATVEDFGEWSKLEMRVGAAGGELLVAITHDQGCKHGVRPAGVLREAGAAWPP
mmetsp:Transcript_134749/g.234195  ORF Transcript_134749/g.234195 Transcript_134749/m.234195 type:complete len:88 (+) Transcript_134749:100-363(+)